MRVIFLSVLALLATAAPAHAAPPVICIDPGHERTPDLSTERIGPGSDTYKIKDGGGTTGEATVVLQIGKKLRKILVRRGYEVVMTRTTMRVRLRKRRQHRAGEVLQPPRRGAHGAHPRRWVDRPLASRRLDPLSGLAQGLDERHPPGEPRGGRGHAESLRREDRRSRPRAVRRADLTGFNWANVPAILVETGFMTNPTEGRKLTTDRYQWKVAHGLTNGTSAFVPKP